jgi:chaperonin GroES
MGGVLPHLWAVDIVQMALEGRECKRGLAPRAFPDRLAPQLPARDEGGGMATKTKVALKPLDERVVVQTVEAEETTSTGLVIPDTAQEKPQQGEVLAVGPGRLTESGERLPLDVKEGDTVVYSKYGGTEIKLGGEEYLILSGRDILAVVQD